MPVLHLMKRCSSVVAKRAATDAAATALQVVIKWVAFPIYLDIVWRAAESSFASIRGATLVGVSIAYANRNKMVLSVSCTWM